MIKSTVQETSFDSVVMLTLSNWHTEMRSNRYHYASRFARLYPVLFVQPLLTEREYKFEDSEIPGLTILHIWREYDQDQMTLLNEALLERKSLKPLFWVYNVSFIHFLQQRFCPYIVYHATEDYLSSDWRSSFLRDKTKYNYLMDLLKITHLLISVSEGVEEGLIKIGQYRGQRILITNGCDYKFYAPPYPKEMPNNSKKIAIYQGNIFSDKLNYPLLQKLIEKLNDWEFWFCGAVVFGEADYPPFFHCKNVTHFGLLPLEKLKEVSHQATVGLMPFTENDHIINRSFPLKAFEYVACGLPVVTVPIRSMKAFPKLFYFASTAQEFENGMHQAFETRFDSEALEYRLNMAQAQDYDLKFAIANTQIICTMQRIQRDYKSLNFLSLKSVLKLILVPFQSSKINRFFVVCKQFFVKKEKPYTKNNEGI